MPLHLRLGWYLCELTFCIVFFVEMVLRVNAFRAQYFMDLSNLLDFFLVPPGCVGRFGWC